MDSKRILQRIAGGEDAFTEFKRGVDLKRIGPVLSAFANSGGGLLLLGVGDDGEILGLKENPETVSERITGFLQSGLSSPVNAHLSRLEVENACIHWIEVAAQRGYEPIRFNGRVFVRRGRSSVEPSPSELQELYNRFGYVLTEEQTVAETGSDDIERRAFKRFMEKLGIDLSDEPRLPFEKDLLIRAVLAKRGEEMNATLYGLLAFGKDPQGHPQTRSFWLECVAYEGTDRADEVLVSGEARGRINEQVDRAMGWFRGLPRKERYENIQREDRPVVPEAALREAVVNAVCHRDYAIVGSRILVEVFKDRVDITSPGTLPNHMTPESVRAGGHPRSRNELLANYMQTLGYMEGRGRGWPRIRRAMLAHNAREPLLSENRDGRWVRVTLPIVVE